MNREWTSYEGTWREFTDQELAKPGVQIELSSGKKFLIGDVNYLGGVCDCCSEEVYDAAIVRYRTLLFPHEMKP